MADATRFVPKLAPLTSSLQLAGGGFNLARALETGNKLQAASAGVGLVGGGSGLLGALKLAPASVTGPIAAATGPASLALGLAAHDPSSVISGLGGSITGGMTLANLAAAKAAFSSAIAAGATPAAAKAAAAAAVGAGSVPASTMAGVAAPLVLVPALSMYLGGQREAAIEAGYRGEATQAVQALTSSPDYRSLGMTLARYQSGDPATLPSLTRAAALAAVATDRLNQPEGSTGLGAAEIVQAIYKATQDRPADYNAVVEAVARSVGWDPVATGRSALDFLGGTGGFSGFGALTPPTFVRPPTALTVAGGGDVRGETEREILPPSAYTPPPEGPPPPANVTGWIYPTGDVRATGTAPQPVVNNWIPQIRHPAGTGWLNVVTGEWTLSPPPFHTGGIVPRTGAYTLEAGEAVLPARVVAGIAARPKSRSGMGLW